MISSGYPASDESSSFVSSQIGTYMAGAAVGQGAPAGSSSAGGTIALTSSKDSKRQQHHSNGSSSGLTAMRVAGQVGTLMASASMISLSLQQPTGHLMLHTQQPVPTTTASAQH